MRSHAGAWERELIYPGKHQGFPRCHMPFGTYEPLAEIHLKIGVYMAADHKIIVSHCQLFRELDHG